jgi:PAS domain S-box-containing protein
MTMRTNADRYRDLIERFTDSVMLLDPSGRCVYVNAAAERALGERLPELRERVLLDAIPAPLSHAVREAFEAAVEHQAPRPSRSYRAHGRWYRATAHRTADGVLAELHDVTEALETAGLSGARRESPREEGFRRLVDAVQDYAIVRLAPDGQLASWNAGARRTYGYPAEEIVGRHFSVLFSPDEQRGDAPAAELRSAIAHGRFEDERLRVRRDGSWFWASVIASPVYSDTGELQGFAEITRDVSVRRRVDELRDRLFGIVGHDLRSPLAAIKMAAEMVQSRPLPPECERPIRTISRSTDRMARLIQELLELTRVQVGGGLPLERERFDLADVTREIVAEAELVHPGRVLHCRALGDCVGEWDRARLSQVLSNLVGNALQYGAPGSPIDVSVRDRGREVTIEVQNAGEPIPPEALPGLFDPFSRGLSDSARFRGGLGLGLYIAREVVAAHGGAISVSSTKEDGTCFHVRLPRAPAEKQS